MKPANGCIGTPWPGPRRSNASPGCIGVPLNRSCPFWRRRVPSASTARSLKKFYAEYLMRDATPAAAEAVRSFLMLRLGLRLGVRQKNLRQLLLRPRGSPATPERKLESRRCGELRWSDGEGGWRPSSHASPTQARLFFQTSVPASPAGPERTVPLERRLCEPGSRDPGTFFVKTVKVSSRNAAYNQNTLLRCLATGNSALRDLQPVYAEGRHSRLASSWTAQCEGRLGHTYAEADRLLRTGQLRHPRYADHGRCTLRALSPAEATLAAQVLNRVWDEAA